MVRSMATDTVKRRLAYNNICPICRSPIKDYQAFEYITLKRGANKVYRFFHTFCLIGVDREENFNEENINKETEC